MIYVNHLVIIVHTQTFLKKNKPMENTTEKIVKASEILAVHSSFENASVRIGDNWYYISYDDLAKILQKSKAQLKIQKKRVRTWIVPI